MTTKDFFHLKNNATILQKLVISIFHNWLLRQLSWQYFVLLIEFRCRSQLEFFSDIKYNVQNSSCIVYAFRLIGFSRYSDLVGLLVSLPVHGDNELTL